MSESESLVASEYLTPSRVAKVIPGATTVTIRRWAADGDLPGAIRLPSGRWQIPWSAVVEILGFDPRERDEALRAGSSDVAG